MNLLILNGPRDSRAARYPNYRGTYRAQPTYVEMLPASNEVNRLFHWFLDEGGERGVLHDVQKALRYAELLNNFPMARQHFEVIEVAEAGTRNQIVSEFYGFDLSAGFNDSLLWWQLEPQTSASSLSADILAGIVEVQRIYGPKLNTYGLFQDSTVARGCLLALNELQERSPNLFESRNLEREFRVVGLSHIFSQ